MLREANPTVDYESFIVIAVTPKFLSGVVVVQSPPLATELRPRFIVMLPEMCAAVNTFACERTSP